MCGTRVNPDLYRYLKYKKAELLKIEKKKGTFINKKQKDVTTIDFFFFFDKCKKT